MVCLSKICKASVVLLVMLVLIGVVGCKAEKAEPVQPKAEVEKAAEKAAEKPCKKTAKAPADWTLQFSDDFGRADLGKDWMVLSGTWVIKDGWLSMTEAGWEGSEMMCTKKFPGAQRLEFDAKTDNPCDLTGIICADQYYGYEIGYFVGFGSNYNTRSKLLIQAEEVKEWDTLITPGKVHHQIVQRDGNTITHIVDGKTVMTYEDPYPLKGDYHEMVGFYIFTEGQIDNVKVYTKAEK